MVRTCNINLPGAKNSDLPISIFASIAGNERTLNDLDTLGNHSGNHMSVATSLRLCHGSYISTSEIGRFSDLLTKWSAVSPRDYSGSERNSRF